jgi:hypothetical protein
VAPTIALLLVGYPEPLGGIVRALAGRDLLPDLVSLGDPAGRPIFPDWWNTVGEHGATVPFLSYRLPGQLTPIGDEMSSAFRDRHEREPSFVALEGYDAIAAMATALEEASQLDSESICSSLCEAETPGTRDLIRFSTEPEGVVHQQWAWPPVCVAMRSSGRPLSEETAVW